jgi:hypothetical protein
MFVSKWRGVWYLTKNNCSLWENLPCICEVRGHCMCKEMPLIPVNMYVGWWTKKGYSGKWYVSNSMKMFSFVQVDRQCFLSIGQVTAEHTFMYYCSFKVWTWNGFKNRTRIFCRRTRYFSSSAERTFSCLKTTTLHPSGVRSHDPNFRSRRRNHHTTLPEADS